MTTVALVDDHHLFRRGLASIVSTFAGFEVLFEAGSGKECLEKMESGSAPDIILMDINMKEGNGFETTGKITAQYPDTKVIALSMYDDEASIIMMLKNGAKGYLLKDTEPDRLRMALEEVRDHGFYYTSQVGNLLANRDKSELTEREIEFLKLCCTELTYKEIADQMHLSPRTIDGYRETLFEKLEVKNRVGLVIYAIRMGYVKV